MRRPRHVRPGGSWCSGSRRRQAISRVRPALPPGACDSKSRTLRQSVAAGPLRQPSPAGETALSRGQRKRQAPLGAGGGTGEIGEVQGLPRGSPWHVRGRSGRRGNRGPAGPARRRRPARPAARGRGRTRADAAAALAVARRPRPEHRQPSARGSPGPPRRRRARGRAARAGRRPGSGAPRPARPRAAARRARARAACGGRRPAARRCRRPAAAADGARLVPADEVAHGWSSLWGVRRSGACGLVARRDHAICASDGRPLAGASICCAPVQEGRSVSRRPQGRRAGFTRPSHDRPSATCGTRRSA